MSSKDELKSFFAESLLMKDFSHPNILGLAGVCFDTPDGVPYILLPFMANGSLKDFLKKKRTHVINVDILPEVKRLNRQLHGASSHSSCSCNIDFANEQKLFMINNFFEISPRW